MKRSTIVALAIVLTLLLLGGCADNPTGMTEPTTEAVSSSASTQPGTPTTADVRYASIEVYFDEFGSGKYYDDFNVKNLSSEGIEISSFMLTLRTASVKLIFDVVPMGFGVGNGTWMYTDDGWECGLMSWHGINDGSQQMGLVFGLFSTGKIFRFKMDVDRQVNFYQYVEDITGSQIAGATMMFYVTGDGITPTLVPGVFVSTGPTTAKLVAYKAF